MERLRARLGARFHLAPFRGTRRTDSQLAQRIALPLAGQWSTGHRPQAPRPPQGHRQTADTTPGHRRRPPARGGPTIRDDFTELRTPTYDVYSRATPGGWPARVGGLRAWVVCARGWPTMHVAWACGLRADGLGRMAYTPAGLRAARAICSSLIAPSSRSRW